MSGGLLLQAPIFKIRRKMIKYEKLPCGVGFVSEELPEFASARLGIWIGAGSAFENEENGGVSHLAEHMFFKGTKNRSAKQIARDADDLGCSLNAFTGKEGTCFHIKALSDKILEAAEILLDMLCNSVFAPSELSKEKGVIFEEMKMIEDTPDDYIIDLITQRTLAGTPYAAPVIGSRKSLKSIDRARLIEYIDSRYKLGNMVVSVAGNFDEKALKELIDEKLSNFEDKTPQKSDFGASEGRSFSSLVRNIGQSHLALGTAGVPMNSELYYVQAIVSDILGGSMSSRFFQSIREEQGLAYSVYSAPQSFSRAGMFLIYAGVKAGTEERVLREIEKQLTELADEGISEEELATVKLRFKSAQIFSMESLNSRMFLMGRDRLIYGRNYSPDEIAAEIEAVTAEQVKEYARSIADFSTYSAICISNKRVDIKRLMGG